MRVSLYCCAFSNLHASGAVDELEVAEKIKKKCEHLSVVILSHFYLASPMDFRFYRIQFSRFYYRIHFTTHLENLEKSGMLRVVRENSGKMCACMHEIWLNGSRENHWKLLPPDVSFYD